MAAQDPTDQFAVFARLPLLALGFRPFYLLAGIFAVMALPLWLMSVIGGAQVGGYLSGMAWHSHEMIFGFAAAVIAGFLLTAVRNWTGQQTATGVALALLVLLWLAARILMFSDLAIVAAFVDILFLPMLGLAIAIPIWRSRNSRNYKVLVVLLALTLANVGYHLANLNFLPAAIANVSLSAALDTIAILVAIMGGRVIPAFINNAIEEAEPRHNTVVEIAAVGSLIAILVTGILAFWIDISDFALAALFAVAAIAHGIRLLLWQPFRTGANPLLWMLPVAYAWLPLALALRALTLVVATIPGAATHALTVGAIASLMVAMMVRSALGHSGRPLRATPADIAVFVILQLAAVVRVFAGFAMPAYYRETMLTSGLLWTLAFGVFVLRYWPVLTRPRIDGRPG